VLASALTARLPRKARPGGVGAVRDPWKRGRTGDASPETPRRRAYSARSQEVLVTDDAQGRLVLRRATDLKRAAGALVQGQNILAAEAALDVSERRSVIVVKAQRANLDDRPDWDGSDGNGGDGGAGVLAAAGAGGDGGEGDDSPNVGSAGDTGVAPSGRTKDLGVTRSRPLIVPAEMAMDAAQAAGGGVGEPAAGRAGDHLPRDGAGLAAGRRRALGQGPAHPGDGAVTRARSDAAHLGGRVPGR
jgi:hypothetical protein